MNHIYTLENDISLIDLYDLKRWNQTGSYILHEESLTIIETSSSPSIPYLLAGLKELNINLEKIQYIIVTHIHLDHSGGAGLFLQYCPNAKIVVHPNGKKHLVNPSKLIESAKQVYQDGFKEKFDPILPIPEDRIMVMEDQQQLQLSDSRILTFHHTRGHANHHFSIYDSKSKGLFTGDSCGINFGKIDNSEVELILPTTSPNQFDYEAALAAIDLMEKLRPEVLYFSHFGPSKNVTYAFTQMRKWLSEFIEIGIITYIEFYEKKPSTNELVKILANRISKRIVTYFSDQNIYLDEKKMMNDVLVSSMGLLHYMNKKNSRVLT